MSDKAPFSRFAQTFPTGAATTICGIGVLSLLSRNPVIACLLGILGAIIGIATLKLDTQKLDKILALIGTILSLVPMIYAIVSLIRK